MALGPPATLASRTHFGVVDGLEAPAEVAFPVDFLAVSWDEGHEPWVRFRHRTEWTRWTRVEHDDVQGTDGRTYGALVPAHGADAYQVRGDGRGVEAVALNTTDGPRGLVWRTATAEATHLAQPPVVTRSQWGADESLRFDGSGEKGTRTFYPTQKLIVHHTVTANADPDPAATIRAIYYDHVVNRGFIDIAYNFLIDAQGRLYKGRYSGPHGTKHQDTITGENGAGLGVTGAHTAGYNSGTMGVAVLGNYVSTPIPGPARETLVRHLAWEAERHGLGPQATSTYTNPESSAKRTTPNIAGHRAYTATQCPGERLNDALPGIRADVAALVGSLDTKPPRIARIEARKLRPRSAVVRWRTSEPAGGQIQYWEKGKRRRTTPPDGALSRGHKMRVGRLRPGTAYRFRVLGWDAAGNRAASRPKRLVTPS
ncbi:MAG TPA: N-acetylmuramoyl-L-alanine amidase [Actinomycetota bacterium]|nr:N-acetylmuramoyl-L-alanine amidase [Actinomycetota bacterium]